ncbi:Crp/Fnr family transcriptional regulator [Brevundimonas sp.]|uniref:Crp/Fnr family transcriptional regulator n=1 Tax=Brevundimonas sp. TaxID=1871086 RepID=UPI0039E64904
MAPSRRTALLEAGRRIRVQAGAAAYRAGDPPDGLYRVVAGHIRLVSYPVAGRQLVNLMVSPPEWFGELSTLDQAARPHDAVAVGQVLLFHIPQNRIERLGQADPALYRDIALLACRHQRMALDYIGAALGRSAAGRLAQTLLAMAGPLASEGSPPSLRISQDDLSGPAGLSRQTLNRHLQTLEAKGLLRRGYGHIELLDLPGLASIP